MKLMTHAGNGQGKRIKIIEYIENRALYIRENSPNPYHLRAIYSFKAYIKIEHRWSRICG
jgi:hypothetical protein